MVVLDCHCCLRAVHVSQNGYTLGLDHGYCDETCVIHSGQYLGVCGVPDDVCETVSVNNCKLSGFLLGGGGGGGGGGGHSPPP